MSVCVTVGAAADTYFKHRAPLHAAVTELDVAAKLVQLTLARANVRRLALVKGQWCSPGRRADSPGLIGDVSDEQRRVWGPHVFGHKVTLTQ